MYYSGNYNSFAWQQECMFVGTWLLWLVATDKQSKGCRIFSLKCKNHLPKCKFLFQDWSSLASQNFGYNFSQIESNSLSFNREQLNLCFKSKLITWNLTSWHDLGSWKKKCTQRHWQQFSGLGWKYTYRLGNRSSRLKIQLVDKKIALVPQAGGSGLFYLGPGEERCSW